jgi:2-dehydro-3-deoxygluconokinase
VFDVGKFKSMINAVVLEYPNIKATATTLRTVKSASLNDWGAICWAGGQFFEAVYRSDLEIFDRVGGGDSFASGFVYGLMTTGDPAKAVNYGAAHGAPPPFIIFSTSVSEAMDVSPGVVIAKAP